MRKQTNSVLPQDSRLHTKDLTKVTPKQINEVEEKSCSRDNFSNIKSFQSANETTTSRLSTQINANFIIVSIVNIKSDKSGYSGGNH